MTGLELPIALFLLVNLAASLWRVLRGPGDANRLLAALLFGSTGVGVLVLLAFAGERALTPFLDVALTLALLAAITAIAFAQRAWRRASAAEGHDD
ncbi:MAG: monovalent cation/H+ antiporter complex subunit F [Candidatus Accumulibacter sp.]|uniref:monovalent cation/H+ antiporter complex subunit F n=1 Tax=Accumulibacter sp. TaxID=2053492 RepID=UPI00287AA77C|nr:monovalent cation/H+ antiporter complex subunit F [Accumulibacter sp.]MDS4013581.1 monovalent cation/H+ antiporter complex subunit F [Accumulibacter sp.]